ncbi:bacteriorhodopsin [Halobiforma nitratireducens]|uniref:Rhodopsin n=1 Tax=Halobiforma nitratireducens JCM 10879 TaxID=1227454 RepID=M0M6W4_9EURY|nr:bacteriorhodopsin [Halobiforma nitratireducens]EMA41138.1 rhodopsin [Halobiforma nitratireducens JCM 10879]
MIAESTVFLASSAVLGVLALSYAVWTSRLPASVRRYGGAVVVGTASMSVAYLLMAEGFITVQTTGREQSVARFLGYTVAWAMFAYLLGAVSNTGRRYTAALLVSILWMQWAALVSWIVAGTAETLVSVSMVAALAAIVSLLFGQFTRRARQTTGSRFLLFSKLKYLTVLGWTGLVTAAVVSEQNLALVDMFVGQAMVTYIDVVLLAGLGGIVLRHVDALEETAAGVVDGGDIDGNGGHDDGGSSIDSEPGVAD